MSHSHKPSTKLGQIINEVEESIIAILLGLMTLITFVNVVLRYGFNTGIIWGLESVSFLFAWLVLFGVSYGFKVRAHLGVDALINVISKKKRKSMGRGSVRAELEDLADDDDDDDDDDAKKKSLKLSWVYIKPSARNNFFFCRVGHADARFSISISILGFFF